MLPPTLILRCLVNARILDYFCYDTCHRTVKAVLAQCQLQNSSSLLTQSTTGADHHTRLSCPDEPAAFLLPVTLNLYVLHLSRTLTLCLLLINDLILSVDDHSYFLEIIPTNSTDLNLRFSMSTLRNFRY